MSFATKHWSRGNDNSRDSEIDKVLACAGESTPETPNHAEKNSGDAVGSVDSLSESPVDFNAS